MPRVQVLRKGGVHQAEEAESRQQPDQDQAGKTGRRKEKRYLTRDYIIFFCPVKRNKLMLGHHSNNCYIFKNTYFA
jgi:hypothetical protein